MISNDEVIDEYGNSWNPNEHPIQDKSIPYVSYGVAINTDNCESRKIGSTENIFLNFVFGINIKDI